MRKRNTLESAAEWFWPKVRKTDGCWTWTACLDADGYGVVRFEKVSLAHRVSYRLCCGEIPKGMNVLHHCDNPPCVNPKHLYVGTQKDNSRDKESRGRGNHPFGEDVWNASLTVNKVFQIRTLSFQGFSKSAISRKMRVGRSAVQRVLLGRTWRWLAQVI